MKNRALCIAMYMIFVSWLMPDGVMSESEQGEKAAPAATDGSHHLVAYYFHGNFRCTNCRKIEEYSREAIEKYFTEELKTKKLVFSIINTDQPENKHFIKDYQLYTRSLIIAEFKGGKQVQWKNLTGVWNHLGNREKFYDYVRSEIRACLEAI